ncbi:MAG: SPFH domain-containing protein, partial [Spirochaetales bacterium]|nr:SPFH domain-containing protein [Spirochaetales bacterium]
LMDLEYLIEQIFYNRGATFSAVAAVVVFFLLIALLKTFIKVALPQVLIVVNGRKSRREGKTYGFSVVRGRTTVIPYFQEARQLDLGIYPIKVRVEGVNSANGITVGADATACVCIDTDDPAMVYTAVEKLLGKSRHEIQEQIQSTLIGNFRGALNKATPQEAIGMINADLVSDGDNDYEGSRAKFREELVNDINNDLSTFGMKVVSVSFQNIWDTSNYIANLAQKTLSGKRKEVAIEEARLVAEADKAESDSNKIITLAKNKAEEAIIATRQKVELYRKESENLISEKQFLADNSIEKALNEGQARIQEQQVELMKLKNQSELLLQAEAEQKVSELLAEGENEAVHIVEKTRNVLLQKKAELLQEAGQTGSMVLFMNQLPHLYSSFKENSAHSKVDTFMVMDEKTGFSGAVNRGPAAFSEFLKHFQESMGLDIPSLMGKGGAE